MTLTIEATEAPEGEETILESTPTTVGTEDTSGEAAVVQTADTSKDEGPKSLLEALTAGIEEGQKPRRITSKSEESSETPATPKQIRNADGTFRAETDEEKVARELAEAEATETPEAKAERLANETPEEKAAREKKEAAAKKPDPINDPIPEGLTRRTAERMKYLLDTVKAQGELAEQHSTLFSAITNTGASPEEFSTMLSYMGAVHSNDPKLLESAYTILQNELTGLAIKLGKPIPEVNLLRKPENADLVEDIRDGKLTNPRAHELALMRETQRVGGARATAQTKAQTEAEAQTASNAAFDALDQELRARDGAAVFEAKFNILVPMLRSAIMKLPVADRIPAFREAYEKYAYTAPVAAPVAAVPPKQQPLRPKSPAGSGGGAAQAPKSAMDAISQALDGM